MRDYLDVTVREYLEELSARRIVPGGGSAAALAAALGAGLNLMVIEYSAGTGNELAELRKDQKRSMDRLAGLVDEDCRAFDALMRALAGKKDAQKEYIAAAEAPLEICRECRTSLDITVRLRVIGKKELATDVGCAAHMLKAGYNAARLNAEVNLRHIGEEAFVRGALKELDELGNDIADMAEKVIAWLPATEPGVM